MRLKLKRRFLILFITLFFLTNLVMSQGASVSPSTIKMNFVPNFVYEGEARFGTGGRTNHLAIGVGADGFEIEVDKRDIYCDIEPCSVNFKITLPESMDRPGKHVGRITAREVFDTPQRKAISVGVAISLRVEVFVPYPGKYLEFRSFEVINKEAGETIPLTAVLLSRGDQKINLARGTILIYDNQDNRIGSVSTHNVIDIEPAEEITLFGEWDSGDYERGRYHALMIVSYDGSKVNETTKFKLGGLDVELTNYTRKVIKGGIKPFALEVDSIWGETIPNLKARVGILNNKGNREITSFETLTKGLGPWRRIELLGYLDTQPLNLSDYKLNITLFFENLTKRYDGRVNITEEPVVEGKKKKSSIFTIKTLLIALIVVLVLAVIFLIYLVIPKPKKEKFKKRRVKEK